MAEARHNSEESDVADSHDAFARLADASVKLFAEQAAAMAAVTAFGISVAGQMTGLMLDAITPAEGKGAGESSDREPVAAARSDANVVHLRTKTEHGEGKPAVKTNARPRATKAAPGKAAAPDKVAKVAPKVHAAKTEPKVASASARVSDDLKRISGIGPRLEKVLNARSISTYEQVAGLSKAALKKIDDDLGLEGRVIRDDWVGQARALAAGGSDATR